MDSDIVVLRRGTEALPTSAYAEEIKTRLPQYQVRQAETPQDEIEYLRRARVATGIDISEDQVEKAENLELFVVASSGTDHLPTRQLREKGVTIANSSGIHAPGIAEQTLGYLLMFARKINQGIAQKQDHEWRHYQATELQGSTVTVVGLGSIGKEIVNRLEPFNVDTIGIRYTPSKGGPTDEVVGFDSESVHRALARTDYLVLCSPLTSTTKRLISEEEIGTLSSDAVLINVARGGLVDTPCLVEALQTGELRGAALDVTDPEPLPPDHPLWTLNNVIITPHMGGHTPKHWSRLADILAQNIRALDNEQPEFTNVVSD